MRQREKDRGTEGVLLVQWLYDKTQLLLIVKVYMKHKERIIINDIERERCAVYQRLVVISHNCVQSAKVM